MTVHVSGRSTSALLVLSVSLHLEDHASANLGDCPLQPSTESGRGK